MSGKPQTHDKTIDEIWEEIVDGYRNAAENKPFMRAQYNRVRLLYEERKKRNQQKRKRGSKK